MGGVRPETQLVEKFDKDSDKRLNADERKAAYEFIQKEIAEGRGPRDATLEEMDDLWTEAKTKERD